MRLLPRRPHRPAHVRRLRWAAAARRLLGAACAVLLVGTVAVAVTQLDGHAGTGTPATGFSATDIGFAEGIILPDSLDRRLDGMAGYVPGAAAPILRVDLDWWYIEDCRGCALRWDRLDAAVGGAAARGMRVLLVLDYAPPWANGGHADDKWFPVGDADWSSIIDRTVAHVGAAVQAYEVWNEPNITTFGNFATDPLPRYWQLVRLAHQRVRAGCPDCVVLAGGSAGGGSASAESGAWLDWAYTNGYGADFDAVAHHPYPAWNSGYGPARAECTNRWWNMFGPPGENPACGELAYVHSVMVRHGDTAKKIWGTEYGYPTGTVPPATIRDYLVQGVRMWRGLAYTGPLFLYSYRDACATAGDPECHFGVVTTDFAAKEPIFSGLSSVLRPDSQAALRSGESLLRLSPLTSLDGRFQLWLQDDGNLVLYRRTGAALWATGTRTGAHLDNQADGNLVLYRADGAAVWSSRTAGNGAATLWLQQDGNLVLYRNRDGKAIWASNTVTS
jgi:hypothetical protein